LLLIPTLSVYKLRVPGDSRTPGHSVQATPHAPVCVGLPISLSGLHQDMARI